MTSHFTITAFGNDDNWTVRLERPDHAIWSVTGASNAKQGLAVVLRELDPLLAVDLGLVDARDALEAFLRKQGQHG